MRLAIFEVENQLRKEIKRLGSNKNGEHEAPFGDFYVQHRISHNWLP